VEARDRQRARFRLNGIERIFENGQMSVRQVRHFCPLQREAREVLRNAVRTLGFSARAYDRILRVSRTIADLDGQADIGTPHLAEAIGYRVLDRATAHI
jgi:magnesium chelatase family protein